MTTPQKDNLSIVIGLIKDKLKSHPVRLPVRGISMAPAILPGQKVVIIAKRPETIEIGDILLFHMDNRMVLHRVVYKESIAGENLFLTRGDPCDALDDWIVKEENIIGVVEPDL